MAGLRVLADIACKQCGEVFRPRRSETVFCSKACWHASIRLNERACRNCGEGFKARYAQQSYCCVDCKVAATTKDKSCVCAECGTTFERPHGKARAYCSIACSNRARAKGLKKPEIQLDGRVVGGKTISTHGYVLVRVNGKKVLEHRLVMEHVLERPLSSAERVHHKNGDRQDNRPENLELWTGTRKKDPTGVRVIDQVLDMLDSLKPDELARVGARLRQLKTNSR